MAEPAKPADLSRQPIAPPTAAQVLHRVVADLRTQPGRWALSWRMAALCALTGGVFMTYQIPLAAIGCYLIFFVLKPEPTESILMGLAVLVLVSVVVALLFFISDVTLEHPAWRLVVIAIASLLFMFLGVASQVGPVGSILALVVAFAITLFNMVPAGELLTRGLLYAWLMAATPMAILIVFNLLLGRKPTRLLRAKLAERLRVCAWVLEAPHEAAAGLALQEQLLEGNAETEKQAAFLALFHVRPRAETRYLALAASASYHALLAVAAGRDQAGAAGAGADQALAAQLRHRAQALEAGEVPVPPEAGATAAAAVGLGAADPTPWAGVHNSLKQLAGIAQPLPADKPAKPPFFAPDAFTNPDYQRYAIKTTAAALIAYVVYTALDWQDIHTAMITCYVAALATTAETIHKLTLRIIGCLIGATLGILSVHWVMPMMSGVGELMILLFLVCLLASWVATGPERIAYAGVQIALAFLLTVLQGFGPNPEISVAMDRIWGVLLGNFVLFVIFTLIWPASVVRAGQRQIQSLVHGLQALAKIPVGHVQQRTAAAAALLQQVGQARELLQLAPFEPRSQRPSVAAWQHQHQVLNEALALIAHVSQAQPEQAERLLTSLVAWQQPSTESYEPT